MRFRIGRRKVLALFGGLATLLAAWAAHSRWGTDGLVAVALAATLASTAVMAFLSIQAERRTLRRLEAHKRALETHARDEEAANDATIEAVNRSLKQVVDRLTQPGEHFEQLLRAVDGRLTRTEASQTLTFRAVDDRLEALRQQLERNAKRIDRSLTASQKAQFRQFEALIALYKELDPPAGLPATRSWAASPDLLLYLYRMVRDTAPRLVVECGSGISTVVVAHALRKAGGGRVVSLEHLSEYAQATTALARDHGVEQWVEVRVAPLSPVDLDGEDWPWYSLDDLPNEQIDLLFVDGPPGTVRSMARFPALPLLKDRIAPGGSVILDDNLREEEAEIGRRWVELVPNWSSTELAHEKGTLVLTRPKTP